MLASLGKYVARYLSNGNQSTLARTHLVHTLADRDQVQELDVCLYNSSVQSSMNRALLYQYPSALNGPRCRLTGAGDSLVQQLLCNHPNHGLPMLPGGFVACVTANAAFGNYIQPDT